MDDDPFEIWHSVCRVESNQGIGNNWPISWVSYEDNAPMQIDFPDSSVMYVTERTWKMFFDGSHTQNGVGARILFLTPHGYTIPKSYKFLFPCTNNVAEYEALLNGVKLEWRITKLHIFGDSQLVINQVNNEYQTKDDKLVPYKKLVDSLWNYFTFFTF